MSESTIKVVLTYRVLQHWRTPVFRRLATWPDIEFCALHGSDFPGTKAINGKDLSGFRHIELKTIRADLSLGGESRPTPVCPGMPLALWREKPDVILAEGGSNFLNNFLVFAYAIITRTPVVWWTLGQVRSSAPISVFQRVFRWWTRFFERRSTVWLGYSSVAEDYFDLQGYPKDRQFKAVNCIDTDQALENRGDIQDGVDAIRTELDLDGKFVLLFVGALIEAKRLEDLIQVFAELSPDHPDLRLVIVGDGPHRASLEDRVSELGVEGVIFTGQVVDGVGRYFELGNVFVLPGLGGLAISEAMVYGLPVVATQADGCEVDLVSDGENGALVGVGDLAALKGVLGGMASDPQRTAEMGRRSSWIIANRYNIGTYMENVVAALHHAVRVSRRQAD